MHKQLEQLFRIRNKAVVKEKKLQETWKAKVKKKPNQEKRKKPGKK